MAFLSASVQMLGLYGKDGISPVNRLLHQPLGPSLDLFLNFPSVFWFDSSDQTLVIVPLLGALFSCLALLGFLSGPCILLSWFLYLSIVTVGQEFMSFQWDILLLETGFLCVFLASWRPLDFFYSKTKFKLPQWTFDRVEPSLVLVWLCRLLLFRLMFQSGLCKIESGDETWRDLTAMTYHYETQPLPTPFGWFAHHLPDPILLFSTASVFALELLLPLLIFAGRRARLAVAVGTVFLQILILLTGNYCFFNLLTIALCLMLLDDGQLMRLRSFGSFLRFKTGSKTATTEGVEISTDPTIPPPNRMRNFAIIPLTILIVFLSTSRTLFSVIGSRMPPLCYAIMEVCQPWHLVSTYGLFAVMTTSRPEISIEGSMDGENWKEYVFRYKPGPLDRAPPIVAPHQPRLDWQMWFASLGTVYENQWLVSFAEKLLEASPNVLGLLETDPFHGEKPKYIRAQMYDYHMEDLSTLFSTGRWWKRTYTGVYLPAITKTAEQ